MVFFYNNKSLIFSFWYISDLCIDALFKPSARINQEHKAKYVFLLASASCVVETYKKVTAETNIGRLIYVLQKYICHMISF